MVKAVIAHAAWSSAQCDAFMAVFDGHLACFHAEEKRDTLVEFFDCVR